MKSIGCKLSLFAASCACALSAQADTILFKNVNVFNGTDNKLYENHYVLVEDNLIKAVSKDVFDAEPREADLDTIKVIMKDGVVYKNTL
ncbi:hypothetical protein [Vibrio mediterranei]|uniref:hypothetical protein n=1 Tax=Vibrio mediterranei TaxID=689 RepID=UPI001C120C9D